MWYFSWILGLGLALTFGVLNAIWYEIRRGQVRDRPAGTARGCAARRRVTSGPAMQESSARAMQLYEGDQLSAGSIAEYLARTRARTRRCSALPPRSP